MEPTSKRFSVNVTCRVQDVGFRDFEELGRKLDNGIGLLRDIKGDTSTLHSIEGILKDISGKI